jgi:hypothetical protein
MQTDPTLYADQSGSMAALAAMSGFTSFLGLIVAVLAIVALWKIFTKAGEPGWYSIIPIWNTLVLLRIVGRPMWWIILLLIPFVNIVIIIIVMNDLSKSFGQGIGFTIGLILLSFIFMLVLAFGKYQYVGPGGRAAAAPMPPAYTPPAPPAAPSA